MSKLIASNMHKRIIIVSLLILFTTIGYGQSDRIKILSDQHPEVNYLQIDDFYLTHYLYIDLFLRESLFTDASAADVSAILQAIKKYVSPEAPLEIQIENPDKSTYLIKMVVFNKEDGSQLLIAFTNWSVKKRMFEDEIKMENDSYTRWYFINEDKITYRKDMSDHNDYSTMSPSDLANAYLLDELSENDSKIKSTLDQVLNQDDVSLSDTIMNHLILLKYYIFKRDSENVIKETKYLTQLFDSNVTESNLKGLEMAFNATKFQIDLMK